MHFSIPYKEKVFLVIWCNENTIHWSHLGQEKFGKRNLRMAVVQWNESNRSMVALIDFEALLKTSQTCDNKVSYS